MRLIYLSGAFLVGLYLGAAHTVVPLWAYALAFSGLLFLFLTHRFGILLLASVCLALIVAGFCRSQSWASRSAEDDLSLYNGRRAVQITGTIQGDPEILDRGVRFTLAAKEIVIDSIARPVSGKALVYTTLPPPGHVSHEYPYFRYGDALRIEGRLQTPPRYKDFDYREYLAIQGIHSIINFPESVAFISSDNGNTALAYIYRLRTALAGSLASHLPEPEASLSQAILLGIRADIPRTLSDAFSRTGTTHVLAISGQNLSIVAGLLLAFGVWLLGRRHHLHIVLALLVIWFYATLTGLIPSVVRAAIMATVFLVAELLGRPSRAAPATFLAAALMVGLQPSILSDVGFQLSFLAMLGLIYLAPRFHTAWAKLSEERLKDHWWGTLLGLVIDSLGISLAATLFTWPVIAYNFHNISLVGLPATLLLLPVLAAIILLSAATALVGLALPLVAQVMAWVAWLPLVYMVAIVEIFGRLSFASLPAQLANPTLLISYYAAMAVGIWFASNPVAHGQVIKSLAFKLAIPRSAATFNLISSRAGKWLVATLLVLASLVWMGALTAPDGRLHVSFFDPDGIGAVLIQTPDGKNILIDGGPSPEKLNTALGNRLPFWQRRLHLVVLTAPESSRLPGLIDVLRRYQVDQVLQPDTALLPTSSLPASYFEWRREIKDRSIPSVAAAAGQWVDLGKGYRLDVVHPAGQGAAGSSASVDDTRVILRVEAGKISFLLGAEVDEDKVIDLLAQHINLKSTVLQIPHPHTETFPSKMLLDAVAPQIVVAPPFPPTATPQTNASPLASTASVLTIAPSSIVEVITDGKDLWVKTDR